MYQHGHFPFDRLIKKYAFEDINQAVEDSEKGRTISMFFCLVTIIKHKKTTFNSWFVICYGRGWAFSFN